MRPVANVRLAGLAFLVTGLLLFISVLLPYLRTGGPTVLMNNLILLLEAALAIVGIVGGYYKTPSWALPIFASGGILIVLGATAGAAICALDGGSSVEIVSSRCQSGVTPFSPVLLGPCLRVVRMDCSYVLHAGTILSGGLLSIVGLVFSDWMRSLVDELT